MTKSELEHHWSRYHALLDEARHAIQYADYGRGVELAMACCDHLDGMVRYERKYRQCEVLEIEALRIIFHWTPILLDADALSKVERLLKSQRRVEKASSHDLARARDEAYRLLWQAHRLWNEVERHTELLEHQLWKTLGGEEHSWRSMIEAWEKMGVVRRFPSDGSHKLSLTTRFADLTVAKCPSCAALCKAQKEKFLDEVPCPKCHKAVNFVLISVEHPVSN